MTEWQAKRFWTAVTVEATESGWQVLLDGRPVRTPGKAALVLPTSAMADAMAAEWEAQEGDIQPLTMPVTRSANSAIDRVAVMHDEVADMLAAYAETDLLCYRAEGPEVLGRRQAEAWDPILDWASDTLNVRLTVTAGVLPVAQPGAALAAVRRHVVDLSDFHLTALHDLVTVSGSVILGLAVAKERLDPDVAFDLSRIDEEYQIELWGRDEEADAATEARRQQYHHAHRFWGLSGDAG